MPVTDRTTRRPTDPTRHRIPEANSLEQRLGRFGRGDTGGEDVRGFGHQVKTPKHLA